MDLVAAIPVTRSRPGAVPGKGLKTCAWNTLSPATSGLSPAMSMFTTCPVDEMKYNAFPTITISCTPAKESSHDTAVDNAQNRDIGLRCVCHKHKLRNRIVEGPASCLLVRDVDRHLLRNCQRGRDTQEIRAKRWIRDEQVVVGTNKGETEVEHERTEMVDHRGFCHIAPCTGQANKYPEETGLVSGEPLVLTKRAVPDGLN